MEINKENANDDILAEFGIQSQAFDRGKIHADDLKF